MRRAWPIYLSLLVLACAARTLPRAPGPTGHDDPASCVDGARPSVQSGPETLQAVMTAIAGSADCADSLPKPANVLVFVAFRPDGTTQGVQIARASTDDCQAVECVRRHLAAVKAPVSTDTPRVVRVDFTLRRSPAPDGNESIQWDAASDSKQCVDDEVNLDSQLSRPRIRSVMVTNRERFRACYNSGLLRDPTLRGRVDLLFHVDANGKVTSTSVIENRLPDCKVTACMEDEVRKLRFPPSNEPITVHYPFLLEPSR